MTTTPKINKFKNVKICQRCGVCKPLSEFLIKSAGIKMDRYSDICIQCRSRTVQKKPDKPINPQEIFVKVEKFSQLQKKTNQQKVTATQVSKKSQFFSIRRK